MTGLRSTLPRAPSAGLRAAVAAAVAVVAFGLYRTTLLPGVDFGDTASFQASVGLLDLSPRQGYPLYFAVGNVIAWLAGGEPAFGLNLASALCGALACGVVAWVAAGMTGSLLAGAAGGLLLATSYTFWTQCVIAEVYALHLLMMALVLAALVWWDRRRTTGRLGLVFALYALSFGNHLMTVLLAPAIVLFVATAPGGLRLLFAPRTLALAAACAAAGACQYLWNASYLWTLPDPPATVGAFLRTFWFDVTKTDWRETMVFGVHEAVLGRRVHMYVFDLAQQFGRPGIALAIAGLVTLAARPRLLLLLVTGWFVAFAFAFTYNVGDAHVFFLPSHEMVALMAAAGVAGLAAAARRAPGRAGQVLVAGVALVALAWPAWRGWQTWPAVDRHGDQRPVTWLDRMTSGLGVNDLLLSDVNWQLENGFDYYQRKLHPELNAVRAVDAVLTLPFMVCDNLAAGRDVLATPIARDLATAAYGNLFRFDPDPRVDARPLSERIGGLPRGTPYVLAVLAPYPDLPFDATDLGTTSAWLTGGTAVLGREPSYTVVAGRIGERPLLDRRSDTPWRAGVSIGGLRLDIRMESWLPTDTIRRAGFGQVIAGRLHALIVERGVSFVAFTPDGGVLTSAYASALYAPIPRYFVHKEGVGGQPGRPGACATLSSRPPARDATHSPPSGRPAAGAVPGAPAGDRATGD